MSAKTSIKLTAQTLASELRKVQAQKEELGERENKIREALLHSLKQQGVRHIRLDDGTMYTRSERVTLKVQNRHANEALKWAQENHSMKIDTAKALRILRAQLELPRFFARTLTEYLTIRRPNEQEVSERDSPEEEGA